MSINKAKTLPELFTGQENSSLDGVIRRGRQLQGLNTLISELLGSELAAHCQLANIRDKTLILTADSAAWATRVRYMAPQLLQKLRSDERLNGIDSVHVKITPPVSPADTSHSIRRASISASASECLSQCAEGIEDPQLSAALRHLAKRKRPDS